MEEALTTLVRRAAARRHAKIVVNQALVEAESAVRGERLITTRQYIARVQANTEAKFEGANMEGHKVVAISHIQDACWYL